MERCELISSAQKLAKVKGLPPQQVSCEFMQCCDGTTCFKIFPNEVNLEANPTQRFFMRLEKTINKKTGRVPHPLNGSPSQVY